MYIISYSVKLENEKNNYEVIIRPPAEMSGFFEQAELMRYHRYQIEYVNKQEIVCPRYRQADGTEVVVIPWFLIPGRPYPIQIYQYACSLYSTNPELGQRGVAEATRKKFNLTTFSHSTVSRSFRRIEQSRKLAVESRFGADAWDFLGGLPVLVVGAAAKADATQEVSPHHENRFPKVNDTLVRREEMSVFLPKFTLGTKRENIELTGCQFVENWHKKTGRLLL